MIKLRHERILILRCILPPKTELPPEKSYPLPPATTWKISNTLARNSSHWEYPNPMRNLKLLEKYQPPPAIKKKKSQSTRKRKNITPRKSFSHPKIASTIMKKPQTPHLKILNFSKNSIGKVFNSFEVTRPIKPSPHENISIPGILTPLESFNLPMHMKIEINHPENISPP